MIIHQIEYGKLSYENKLTVGSETHYVYFICKTPVRTHWQIELVTDNGCQLFLYPGQRFELYRLKEPICYDLLEFSPDNAEIDLMRSLALPEQYSTPPHLSELSTRVRSIYDIHFSADKYRREKTNLLGQMLLYSISSGDPNGDYLSCDVVIDHRRSFDLNLSVELFDIVLADSEDWADDIYLLLSSQKALPTNNMQTQLLILECQAMRQSKDSYVLGMSCHFCHDGIWTKRIFKFSAPLSFPISKVQLLYHYDAAARQYSWRVIERTTGTELHRFTVPSDMLSPVIAASSAVYLYIYRNPIGINVKELTLQYTDTDMLSPPISIFAQSNIETLSPKEQLNHKLRRLRTMVSDIPAKDWTIREAAAFVNLSESRFYYLYKEHFGQTFMSDVIRSRIKLSCVLLSTTSAPIKEIAEKAGYESDSLFYRQFKEQMGISPGDYRKMNVPSV